MNNTTPPYSSGDISGVSNPKSLKELNKDAAIDSTVLTVYSIKQLASTANTLYNSGESAYSNGSLESAYVYYMKGCSITLEVITRHVDYDNFKKESYHQQLEKRTVDALDILGIIKLRLEPGFKSTSTGDEQVKQDNESDSEDITRIMERYPDMPLTFDFSSEKGSAEDTLSSKIDTSSLLDSLPSVPMNLPGTTPQLKTPSMQMPVPKPYKPSPESLSPPPLPLPVSSQRVNHVVNSSPGFHSSSPAPYSTSIKLPPLSNHIYSSSPIIHPRELAKLICDTKNTFSLLLLDVRPRNTFRSNCIKHRWIVQIEPLILQKDVSSIKIQESLIMNPECDQEIFKERNKFDLVVYYDKKSEDMDQNDALKNLRRAIYEHEYSKKLRYMPMLLVGGLEAWTSTIGSRGLYQFETPTQEKEREASPRKSKDQYREHWLQDVVGKSVDNRNMKPVNLHHTLYDYFNHKQDGSSYQSMSQSNIPQPPLQGVFNQSSNSATYHSVPRKMPQPEYYGGHGHSNQPTKEPCYIRNHEIQPNQSSLPSAKGVVPYNSVLKRHNTFIDNPYYGFTSTTNKSFGAPPEPQRPKRPLPPVPQNHRTSTDYSMLNSSHRIVPGSKPPQLPMKPAGLTMAPPHATDQRQAPVSDSSLSQLGFTNNGTVGLKNLGNTCFMNSIIQCLMGTPPFVRYFTSGSFKQHINKKNKLGTGGVLAESFADLLGVMWNGSYTSVSPAPFRRELIKFAPQFSGTEQHDSQEFLNFLLDGIHEDVNMVTERRPATPENAADEEAFEKLKDWEASSIAWNKYLSRNSSVVVSLFQGQMRSRLKCMTCNKTSTTYNSFMSLSLPIPAKRSGPSSVSLLQCLDYFVKEEILEKEDAWFCPRCKALRRATKSLTLSRLPDVLLIHLKRFSFDGPFKDKLETIVKYPIKGLDLSGYIPNSLINPSENRPLLTYDLYGISNHYGSLTGGHYTACVRDGYRDQWHYFDDTRFSVCGEDKVNSRAAYNLFYVRSTVQ